MGLFDKLKEAVGNAIESSMNGPMNEDEKKYYDITLNLLLSVRHLQKAHIQKFIEVKYNERCDEAILDTVLQKFESVTTPKTHEEWYMLTSTQSSRADYKNNGTSWFNKEEVQDICFAEFRENIRSQFEGVFKVVKEKPSKDLLERGIKTITEKLSGYNAAESDYPHFKMAVKVIAEELVKALFDGEQLLKDIAGDMALSHLRFTWEGSSRAYKYIPQLYSLTLRAFHFNNCKDKTEKYISITKSDCLEAAQNSGYYKEELEEDPFADKEKVLQQAAECMLESNVLFDDYEGHWEHWAIQNPKFVDAACSFAWEKVSSELEDTADNVEKAACMIYTYIDNNAE